MMMIRNALLLTYLLASFAAVAAPSPTPTAAQKSTGKKEPIEVTSDQLQVFQNENRAVFTGHVVAIQGLMRLTSDEMTVFYRKTEATDGSEKKPKPAADSGEPKDKNSIQRIEVEGHVFMSNPEETAKGDHGVYNTDTHEIHLIDNVTMTKGDDVLKGDRLVYNMETGQSIVTQKGVNQKTGKPERVRALFVQDKSEGKPANPAKGATPTTAATPSTTGATPNVSATPATDAAPITTTPTTASEMK